MIEQYTPTQTEPFDYQRAGHLLRRIMIGPTDEEIRRAVKEGYGWTLQRVFTPNNPDISYIKDFAGNDPHTHAPPPGPEYDKWYDAHVDRNTRFLQWWLMNMVKTPVSLTEKMMLFWHRLFAIGTFMHGEYLYAQNEVLRRNALGNFKQMIKEQTQDTLMQLNLSLHENHVEYAHKFINENYARELMELYTCGVFDDNGLPNYTQEDVHEAARALTGWFTGLSALGDEYTGVKSRFILERWDSGQKTYLGKTGIWNSFDVIDILFEQRAEQIARRISRRIYKAFVRDTPDESIIEQMAKTFIANNWEVQPVLKELLGSRHFFSNSCVGVLKKSHIEFIVGMIRQLQLWEIPDLNMGFNKSGDLLLRLRRWGEMLHAPANVSGWTGGRDWVNSSILPRRLQFAMDVINGRVYPISYPQPPAIYTFNPITFAERFPEHESLQDFTYALLRHLLPVDIVDAEKKYMLAALKDGGTDYEWDIHNPAMRADVRIRKCLSAIVAHPAYQLF